MWTSTRPIVFGEESVPWSACIASATGAAATVASRVPRSHGRERRPFEGRQAPLADAPKLVTSVGGLSSARAHAAIASLPVPVATTRLDAEGDGCGSKGGGDGGGGDGGGGLGDGGGGEGDGLSEGAGGEGDGSGGEGGGVQNSEDACVQSRPEDNACAEEKEQRSRSSSLRDLSL